MARLRVTVQGAIWDSAIAQERDRFVATISDRLTAALTPATRRGELTSPVDPPGVEATVVGPIVYRTALEASPVPDQVPERLIDSLGSWHPTTTAAQY